MTHFRPCIDLHQGIVKQIVGSSLDGQCAKENFTSDKDAAHYASLYRDYGLTGGHVISLGKGNHEEVVSALRAYPNGLQFGGGITTKNATDYLRLGASHVIVTSYLFENGEFSWHRLDKIRRENGAERLVLDLSCCRTQDRWYVVTDRWQTVTSTELNIENLLELSNHCDEFLIHAIDMEGLQSGIDDDLVMLLGQVCTVAVTYAGGARSLQDLKRVRKLSRGKVDLTIGSALDIFGGNGITLEECVSWNNSQK